MARLFRTPMGEFLSSRLGGVRPLAFEPSIEDGTLRRA
jgi:hypothetical protein